MAKMYYSEEETCEKLGVTPEELMEKFVSTAKLQMYQDGANHVYKSGDVDALVEPAADDDAIVVDEDAINLAELEEDAELSAPGKEDTVITSEGISIFDDEDLQLEPSEALGTAVAPSLDDDVALDGVGSGSGLLDLTHESDETSLGADLDMLDNLDMEGMAGSGLGSGLGDMGDIDVSMSTTSVQTGMMEAPTFVEAVDSSSGFFTGLLVGACVAMIIGLLAAVTAMVAPVASFVAVLQENMTIVVVGLAVFSVAAGGMGAFIGKAFQGR